MGDSSRREQIDVLVGRAAVERGLITPDQLRDAFAEQARGVARGRKRPRRLGAVLASWKAISDEQALSLVHEAEERLAENATWGDQEKLFGQLLREKELATPEQIQECLVAQAEAIQSGEPRIPLLGELLVERGHLKEEAVEELLGAQGRTVLSCSSCGRRVARTKTQAARGEHCAGCNEPMIDEFGEEASKPAGPGPVRTMGKYALHKLLGRGRMGEVFEAVDEQLHRKVALKLMRLHGEGEEPDPREVERFLREAQMAARLPKHPHIVSVYEAGILDDRHYIACEYIQGRSMSYWKREQNPSARRQLRLLRDVAWAVEFAHRNSVLHRDLKPGNVLVDAEEHPYVMDFGLARPADDEAPPGKKEIVGTPAYMSPEQAKGSKTLDARTDVYALGVMLYEIVTGKLPYTGKGPKEFMKNKLEAPPPPPPSSRAQGLPRNADLRTLDRICQKAMAREPAQRTESAAQFARELSSWLSTIEHQKGLHSLRRIPVPWILGGVGAVVLVSILLFLLGTSSIDLEDRLREAHRTLTAGNAEEALTLYRALLADHPDLADAVRGETAAERALERARLEAAVAQAEQALRELREAEDEAIRIAGSRVGILEDLERRKREAKERLDKARQRASDALLRVRFILSEAR